MRDRSRDAERVLAIGARFREERQRLGFSAKAFAEIFLNCNRFTLARIEAGHAHARSGELHIAACCGMDVQYVLTGIRTPQSCLDAIEATIGYATAGAEVVPGAAEVAA